MLNHLGIGIAGLGTVGSAVVRLLLDRAGHFSRLCGRSIVVKGITARDRQRDRGCDLSGLKWYDDPLDLAVSPDVDVLLELIGDEGGVSLQIVERALKEGKHVVTSNKALLARHGLRLAALAEDKKVSLNFEASVAAGVPVIKILRESLITSRIARISGILNGTCNYILTQMEAGKRSFHSVLKEAKALGYAEADASFDVGGFDTAHKLAIVTSLAFGVRIDIESIHVEGIGGITLGDLRAVDELGYRVKLLGIAIRNDMGIQARVHPAMIPKSSFLAQIEGVTNAFMIHGNQAGDIALVGAGAGGEATASAVVSDVIDIARGRCVAPFSFPVPELNTPVNAPIDEARYYVRFHVFNHSGAFASIAGRMAEQIGRAHV